MLGKLPEQWRSGIAREFLALNRRGLSQVQPAGKLRIGFFLSSRAV
jgi:hypothetical protein